MGCISLLGFTAGSGLAWTQIQESGVSNAVRKIGGWISDFFSLESGGGESSSSPSQPLDPITPITQVGERLFDATKIVVGAIAMGYQWIEKSENSQWAISFLKDFWNASLIKSVVFNLHTTIRAWLGIIIDKTALSKFSGAYKTFKALAVALIATESQSNANKTMINWLYARFFINPRKMLTILKRGSRRIKRGSSDVELECSSPRGGRGKGGKNVLGDCFICKSQKTLKQEMSDFLKEGKMPQGAKQK